MLFGNLKLALHDYYAAINQDLTILKIDNQVLKFENFYNFNEFFFTLS